MSMYIWVYLNTKLRQADFFENCHFYTFLSAPEGFLRMSPGFIMSGGVQAIISTCVPNSTF